MGKYSKGGANHRADYDIYDRPCYGLGHTLDCRITRTMPERLYYYNKLNSYPCITTIILLWVTI